MPARTEQRNYGPLSVEDTEPDHAHQQRPSYYLSTRTVRWCLRRRWFGRRFCVVSLTLLCVAIICLLAAKRVFHLSFPNLFRTIFGGGKKSSGAVAACLPNQEIFEANQIIFVEKPSANKTTVERLDLKHTALAFNKSLTGEVISYGFRWNKEDEETTKWRPQGVTTYHGLSGRRYVLISWYGRKDEGYAQRGGRVSFVDVSDMKVQQKTTPKYSYCHVLLVDANFCTLPSIHVGGIEQQNGTLYVADSRKGVQSILEFDIATGLYELPSHMRKNMFGHRYVLRQSGSFHSPTKPSFISYDIDSHKFVVGTYARCGKKVGIHSDSEKCLRQAKNRLVWFDKSDVEVNGTDSNQSDTNHTDSSCWHYFSEMQGAVSARVGNNTIVWVSSSYGPIANSHLHVVNASSSFIGECPEMNGIVLDEVPILQFPPGLEDLHIEQTEDARYMWMTTEFGTRMVFATPLDRLLP